MFQFVLHAESIQCCYRIPRIGMTHEQSISLWWCSWPADQKIRLVPFDLKHSSDERIAPSHNKRLPAAKATMVSLKPHHFCLFTYCLLVCRSLFMSGTPHCNWARVPENWNRIQLSAQHTYDKMAKSTETTQFFFGANFFPLTHSLFLCTQHRNSSAYFFISNVHLVVWCGILLRNHLITFQLHTFYDNTNDNDTFATHKDMYSERKKCMFSFLFVSQMNNYNDCLCEVNFRFNVDRASAPLMRKKSAKRHFHLWWFESFVSNLFSTKHCYYYVIRALSAAMIKCPISENKFRIIQTASNHHFEQKDDDENQTICIVDDDSLKNALCLNGVGFDSTSLIVEINFEAWWHVFGV